MIGVGSTKGSTVCNTAQLGRLESYTAWNIVKGGKLESYTDWYSSLGRRLERCTAKNLGGSGIGRLEGSAFLGNLKGEGKVTGVRRGRLLDRPNKEDFCKAVYLV